MHTLITFFGSDFKGFSLKIESPQVQNTRLLYCVLRATLLYSIYNYTSLAPCSRHPTLPHTNKQFLRLRLFSAWRVKSLTSHRFDAWKVGTSEVLTLLRCQVLRRLRFNECSTQDTKRQRDERSWSIVTQKMPGTDATRRSNASIKSTATYKIVIIILTLSHEGS